MSTTDLEVLIRDYMREFYKMEYTGKMKITKLPVGYCVEMSLGVDTAPLMLCATLEDEPFIKFIKKAIRDHNFHLIDYGKLDLR